MSHNREAECTVIDSEQAKAAKVRARAKVVAFVWLVAFGAFTSAWAASDQIVIAALSGRADRVSGGDVLVRISLPGTARPQWFMVTLNGSDVTDMFRPTEVADAFVGLVPGLEPGKNKLQVTDSGGHRGSLVLTDYPIQGPIVSGPHIEPFICQTQDFVLPDGAKLGLALDADCSAATKITYIYMPRGGDSFKPLPSTKGLPDDLAKTITTTGAVVNFIVRVETATINRGIYQSAILHDPTVDPEPSPFSPPKGWNGILIGMHGRGCLGGWYTQGIWQDNGQSPILDPHRLGRGYALFINTLQNPSNSCNPFVAGETAMMGKEYFIKRYGVPRYSLSMGSSGGAYTSLQVIDSFPGLFDGSLIEAAFPDALAIALSGMDGHLLTHYFAVTNPTGFSEAQQAAVSGYESSQAWYQAANQAERTDPVPHRADMPGYDSAVWNPVVPTEMRYDPIANPHGARPTIWDVAKNIYGTDTNTGFALRVFDNVGVQYGLAALNAGIITKAQFLDLNQKIGGYDRDDNYVPARTVGDEHAILEAYRSGVQLGGGGGLASVPILDLSGLMQEDKYYHYQWFHFAVRARLIAANGNADNHIMWRGDYDSFYDDTVPDKAFDLINRWIASVKADHSGLSQREKIIRDKPKELVDGCWPSTAPVHFIAEKQIFGHEPNTKCNLLWPSYAFPRFVAGGSLAANKLKCALKPVDEHDYAGSLTPTEMAHLRAIFPDGVCDWSKPAIYFRCVEPGISFGPAPSVPYSSASPKCHPDTK